MRAMILGAGLGTRLRPLTNLVPKPLVPLYHRPLVDWAMEACANAGASDFAINTHHLPEAWLKFGEPAPRGAAKWLANNGLDAQLRSWRDLPLALFHEPILLDTGGALQNLGGWLSRSDEPVLVHNGDIFSSLPLVELVERHRASGLPATLALRSHGGNRNIEVNPTADRVLDLRGCRGIGPGTHAFTGIYCVSPKVLSFPPKPQVVSIIPTFLELAARGLLGAVVLDHGEWRDLGDPDSYLAAHRDLSLDTAIHPDASIAPDATIVDSVIGAHANVGQGASVIGCVVWPGVQVPPYTVHVDEVLIPH